MKLIDFMRVTEDLPYLIIYEEHDEENPLWEGNSWDLPWWVADMKLDDSDPWRPPVSFRHSLGEDHDNKTGFVILVKEEEEK